MAILCLANVFHVQATEPMFQDPKTFIGHIQRNYEVATNELLQVSYSSICSAKTIAKRQSWDRLSHNERLDYISAVKCLAGKPSQVDKAHVPGAKHRWDDFVYAHINQTNFAHASGLILPWHRQFVWAYEQALRDDCSYQGYLPYWDWSLYADNQANASVWDGGPAGFGGNGVKIPHSDANATLPDIPGPFFITRKAGTGGGCVTDDAFANWTVSLGPVAPTDNPPYDPYGLRGNPRCLIRDFQQSYSTSDMSYKSLAELLNSSDIHSFRPSLDKRVHPAAHSFAGGDLFDIYSSPNDPVFFLLHSQIDRLWAIWQGQDFTTRTNALDGTGTFFNLPPSANVTLDTILKMGVAAGGDIPVKDVMSPTMGQYCYMYV